MQKLVLFILPIFAMTIVQAKQKICLNMIVKNESRVITRCLDSVIPVIDYWVIVDTGSTDGTQEIIKKHLKNIPGKLYESPWKNFGYNRSEAFELAKGKGDYILFMDADDTLEFEGKAEFPLLTSDLYSMWRGTKDFKYLKPQLAKGNLPWKWIGVTHEYLGCDVAYSSGILNCVEYVSGDGGASSYDPEKFLKNVRLLTDGLKEEPNNSRYVFYLAESYRDAGDKAKALEWYQKRVDMGGWAEEVFWSKLQIGHMLKNLKMPASVVIEGYKVAHEDRPDRSEPIYYLAEIYNNEHRYEEAYQCLREKELLHTPKLDYLFKEMWVDDYGLLFQLSICAYYVGHYQEALDACDKLLANENLPSHWRETVERNKSYPLAKLQEQDKAIAKSKKGLFTDLRFWPWSSSAAVHR